LPRADLSPESLTKMSLLWKLRALKKQLQEGLRPFSISTPMIRVACAVTFLSGSAEYN
jgi:hypothetical protein